MATGFGEYLKVKYVYQPTAMTADETTDSEYVDLLDLTEFEFIVPLGTLASSAGSGSWGITVYNSSTTTAAGAAVAFYYRQSSDTALSDSWGDPTSADSTGLTLDSDDSDTMFIISVDPRQVVQDEDSKRFVYLHFASASDDNTTWSVAAIGIGRSRHPGASMKSSTA